VRVEGGVSSAIIGDVEKLVFAIDGAVAEARTGAFFGNNQAPLTSRTIAFISQSTITQREVESDPSILDPNSPLRGPGFVAPIGIGGHFPPGVSYTPQVDLFGIENTNRDTSFHVGPSGIAGAPDSIRLTKRFNIDPRYIPSRIPLSEYVAPPDSYGFVSGMEPNAQPRGIGRSPEASPSSRTASWSAASGLLPGNNRLCRRREFPLSANYDPQKRDRSLEAEYVAFAALGGSSKLGLRVGSLEVLRLFPLSIFPRGASTRRYHATALRRRWPGAPPALVGFGLSLGRGIPTAVSMPYCGSPARTRLWRCEH